MKAKWMTIVFLLLPVITWGHGGEDHGDKQPTVAKSGMTTQLAKSEEVEVLIKYPKLVSGQETKLFFFITDLKANTPKDHLLLELKFTQEKTAQAGFKLSTVHAASDLILKTQETSIPGMYEAVFIPSEAGKLKIIAQFRGQSLEESVTFSNITIATNPLNISQIPNSYLTWIFSIGAVALTLCSLLWIFRVFLNQKRFSGEKM